MSLFYFLLFKSSQSSPVFESELRPLVLLIVNVLMVSVSLIFNDLSSGVYRVYMLSIADVIIHLKRYWRTVVALWSPDIQ